MAKILSVIIPFLSLCLTSSSASQVLQKCPVIKTKLGSIAGIRQYTVLGNKSFCSYRGIPYAEPPIGELRFKAPIPSKPWNGTLNATEYGSACMQPNSNYPNMSEDCLFVNVFVPEPSICSNSSDIAVIVFIRGGGFSYGTADDDYGPHLLLNECVILVTFNSRLDIFGFLALALREYPGNMALKDQQMLLKWVSRYISAFGGNPKRVTLMGHSSGGVLVSLHRLNEKSSSYFERAYVMSGCAQSYYAVSDSNNKTDLIVEIAKKQDIVIENTAQLIYYLQHVEADFLLEYTPQRDFRDFIVNFTISVPWQPCIEPETALNPFMTKDPQTLLKAKNLPSTIYSYTSLEYIFAANEFTSHPENFDFDKNFTFKLPFRGLDQVACAKELGPIFTAIRRFYFGNATINASQILPLIQLLSFDNVAYPVLQEVAIQALSKWKTEIRLLRVNPRTLLSTSLTIPGNAALAGASHGDYICHYFWCKGLKYIYNEIEKGVTLLQQSTLRTSIILRELLANFAIIGNPVSPTAPFRSFPSVNSNPLTDLPFTELLSISTLASGSNPEHEQLQFWWKINQKLNKIREMPCNQK